MAKKLSERALILLSIVDDKTDRDWSTGKQNLFFVPTTGTYYPRVRGKDYPTQVSGAGDAAAFKSLERRGLIERPSTRMSGDYIYAITEEGRMVIENNRDFFEGE